jgi:hypothetical protein
MNGVGDIRPKPLAFLRESESPLGVETEDPLSGERAKEAEQGVGIRADGPGQLTRSARVLREVVGNAELCDGVKHLRTAIPAQHRVDGRSHVPCLLA